MIFQKPDPNEPKFPFVVMNRHYVHRPMSVGMLYVISEKEFLDSRLKERAFVIDVQCRRFDILDVVKNGRNLNPLHCSIKNRMIRVKYIYSAPIQLSFEDAREIYLELVCSRKWYRENHENEDEFRNRVAKYADMRELLDSIGYLGKWLI